MTQAIAPATPRRELTLAMVCEMTGFAPADVALVSKTVAQGATLLELAQFLHACRILKLDPLLRQAYWIRRRDRSSGEMKGTLQIGIDGFRAIAEGSGVYAGAEPPDFRGQIEWTYRGAKRVVPERCRTVVWKIVGGHKCAFTGEAWWQEFVPAENQAAMWASMPKHMLAKVSEAQALRRAFPALLASLDMDDRTLDMAQDGSELEVLNPPTPELEPELPTPPARRTPDASDYDRIFGADDDDKPAATPEQLTTQVEEDADVHDEPEVPRETLWEHFNDAYAEAKRLGLQPKRLKADAPDNTIVQYTDYLVRQIADHETGHSDG